MRRGVPADKRRGRAPANHTAEVRARSSLGTFDGPMLMLSSAA